jgi:hypothetical protein
MLRALPASEGNAVIARTAPIAAAVRTLALAGLLAAVVLAMVATPAHATASMQFGLEQDGSMDVAATRTEQLDIEHALGARVIRLVLRFDQVARCDPATAGGAPATSPFNTCYDFGTPDAVVAGATARGMTVLFSVYGVPAWEFGSTVRWTGGTDAQFDAFTADYADFAQAAATRYDGAHGQARVPQWTIWNEPNGGAFFEPRFDGARNLIGPQRYARMYDAAARRIKAVDQNLLVAVGPTAPMPPDLKPLVWARAALPVLQQLGSPIDAWAHNGYMGVGSALHTYLKDPTVGLGNIGDLTTTLDGFAVTRGKPVWITEFGYQTPPASQASVSISEQAALLDDAFVFAYRNPRITTLIWYSLFDDGVPNDPAGFQSGLYYARNRCGHRLCPKPSAWEFQHTLWLSPVSKGKVLAWAQGRVDPAKTRIYVRRSAKGAWESFNNPETPRTGTATALLKFTAGMQVMACDSTCGVPRTPTPGVSGGGGAPKTTRKALPGVRLGMAGALASGIAYAVPCTGCTVTAQVLAKGRSSHIRAARKRSVVVGSSKVRRSGANVRVTLRFTTAARKELAGVRKSNLLIRTTVHEATGNVVIFDRPLSLVR